MVRFFPAILAASMLLLVANTANAFPLSYVSDLISTSAPGARATHIITFTLTQDVPASGTITIVPDNAFTLPGSFDYGDMSLTVNSATTTLANTASATDYGVAITSGAASQIAITLDSSSGLLAGDQISLTLASSTNTSVDPINPSSVGSYRIRIHTFDSSGVPLDTGTAMIAVVNQVSMTAGVFQVAPLRSNGLPSGPVAANNPTIELSLNTNELATCRYATSSGITYGAMTSSFLPSVSESFYVDITGFQNNTTYTYYVRCISTQGLVNDDDYVITFTLAPTPISNTSIAESGSSGSGGVGSFPNGSAVLYRSSVSLSGYAPPGVVTVLTDGGSSFSTIPGVGGSFKADVSGIERGVYTFALFATDGQGVRSAPYSATLSVQQGSTNAISGIAIPPTISLEKEVVAVGESASVSGSAIPNSKVELDVSLLDANGFPGPAKIYFATSTDSGAWQIDLAGSDLSQGTYTLSARSIVSDSLSSDFGATIYLGVGQSPLKSCGNTKGDLNGDKKINLIDFSILLTGWGKSGPGDLNCDGTVGLSDFSIMLFNWTG